MPMRLARLLLGLVLVVVGGIGWAHDSRPLYIELHQTEREQFQLIWRTPISVPLDNLPQLLLPNGCSQRGEPMRYQASDAIVQRRELDCAQGLPEAPFIIHYPRGNPSLSTLARFSGVDGRVITEVLAPAQREWVAPQEERRAAVALSYGVLGVQHILQGLDHLLFLICLILLAGSFRRVVATVTGFSVAHSITLVLAALDIVRVQVVPMEAAIALSIVFLATEIVKGRRDTLAWRHPIAVSSTFGLLHGFGFATVLNDIGLPQVELATGVLFFNLGVEVGQLLVVALVALAVLVSRTVCADVAYVRTYRLVWQRPVGYGVGVVATLWLIQRMLLFVA